VWVGNAPKPDLVKRCIASWRQCCPDYEIIEWGNRELEKIDNAYVHEAASEGKWSFVSDYIRLFALYERGGFYCDSDLELTGSLDRFREFDFVTGFERTLEKGRTRPITALMGSVPGDRVIGGLLSDYDGLHFLNDGLPDLTPNTDRITKHFARRFGLTKSKYRNGEQTVFLNERSPIFPYYYFCTPKAGQENYAIHHFNGSWVERGKRRTVARMGNLLLLKFRFRRDEDMTLPLRNGEKLIWSISANGKTIRKLALIKMPRA
jgi:hypothetical protein